MGIDIRTIRDGEVTGDERVLELAFGEIPPPEHVSTWAPLLAPDRSLAAVEGEEVVGGVAGVTMGLTVPGAVLPAGAVIAAGTLPTHRADTLFAWAPAPWCPNVF